MIEFVMRYDESPLPTRMETVKRCKECSLYAKSLQLCGYGGELVHRSPDSFCRDWEEESDVRLPS